MSKKYKYFITCPAGFEHQLAKELEETGIYPVTEKQGGTEFEGTFKQGLEVCLWSRVAGRVFLVVSSFSAGKEQDIYNNALKTNWGDYFSRNKTIAVETTNTLRAFNNTSYLSLLVKDAVSDYFREKEGERPDIDRDDPDVKIHLFTSRDRCTLSFDLGGGSLHQRGYRLKWTDAPIRENTAAGLLLRAGWKETAAEGGSFIDPMCGSGTFLIEAAMIAGNAAPGLLRESFCFENLKMFDPAEWKDTQNKARDALDSEALASCRIAGFDIDAKAVAASLENIKAAGLSQFITAARSDIRDLGLHVNTGEAGPGKAAGPGTSGAGIFSPGLMCINLPYGKRIGGGTEALRELYQLTGEVLRSSFDRWKVVTIAENLELSHATGLKPLQVNSIYNGPIKCVSAIFKIDSSYRNREEHKKDESFFFSEMLANRFKKNLRVLKKWKEKENITCYRVYDADIPEYSAAVDYYETFETPGAESVTPVLHIQEYAPPPEIPLEKAGRRLKEIVMTAGKVLDVEKDNTHVKQRMRQKGSLKYSRYGTEGVKKIVREAGLSFYVNFTDYIDTGLFLDHRIVRNMIREISEGKKFLNLFSYTSTASVYAAAGGASLTVSVDTSQTYLDWSAENLKLNRLSAEKNQFIRCDCMEFLEKEKNRYDIIFIDPPTFSNSKSRPDDFDVQKDHVKLLEYAEKILENNGIIIFSNNYKKFKLDENLKDIFEIKDITKQSIPPDFSRNSRIHSCWILTKK